MNIHEIIEVPDDVNIFILGDIHGCNKMMMDALKLAGYEEGKDYVFGVGDLIDRGPENLEVLAKFLYNPYFRTVRGNHDQFMIGGDYANWMYNGGNWVFDKLDTDTIQMIAEDMDRKMPVFITVKHRGKTYGLVHAGIPFKYPVTGVQPVNPNWQETIAAVENADDPELYVEPYLWDRDVIQEVGFNMVRNGTHRNDPYFNRYRGFQFNKQLVMDVPDVLGVDFVFHGHTGIPFPLKYGNRVYLDTGGVFNGKLTAATVTGDKIFCFTTDKDDPCGNVEVLK